MIDDPYRVLGLTPDATDEESSGPTARLPRNTTPI